jgi:hypothetical protein
VPESIWPEGFCNSSGGCMSGGQYYPPGEDIPTPPTKPYWLQ